MKRSLLLVVVAVLSAARALPAGARDLSLAEALSAAERSSPRLKASRLRERAAREGIGAARAAYYPSAAVDAVDSWGFPGSSGYLGLGGLVGSPYRSGPAAGLVAKETLFDFGRTRASANDAAYAALARREETAIDRYALDRDVLDAFFECSRFRAARDAWRSQQEELELVAAEVSRFVDTGQRSVVDRYLSRAQVEEARTNRDFFQSRMESALARLSLLTSEPAEGLSCPVLSASTETIPAPPANPFVLRARTELEAARNRVLGAKTEYLPRIVGVAGVGTMARARLVDRSDYSAGLGVVLPLFDGFGTSHRVAQARDEAAAKEQELEAVRLGMRELDAKCDEIIEASRARLEHLAHEQALAKEGFRVAKTRYVKFQGTLVDLRDAVRNLGRIETELIDARANLLEAMGAKALLGGDKS